MSGSLAERHVHSTRTLTLVVLGVMILAAVIGATLSVMAFTAAGDAATKSEGSRDAATRAQHDLTNSRTTESTTESRYNDALAALQVYTNKYGNAGLALIQQATSGANPPAALLNERNKFEAANEAVEAAYGNLNAAKDSVAKAEADARATPATSRQNAQMSEAATTRAWITLGLAAAAVAALLIVFLFARVRLTQAKLSSSSAN